MTAPLPLTRKTPATLTHQYETRRTNEKIQPKNTTQIQPNPILKKVRSNTTISKTVQPKHINEKTRMKNKMKRQQETTLKIIYTNANGITGKMQACKQQYMNTTATYYAVLQKPNSKDNLQF